MIFGVLITRKIVATAFSDVRMSKTQSLTLRLLSHPLKPLGKVYGVVDFAIGTFVVLGLALFMHADANSSAVFGWKGVVMLVSLAI